MSKILEMTDRGNEYTTEPIDSLEDAQIINFYKAAKEVEAGMPHLVSEVICVKCAKRWISVRPVQTLLKDLECPNCGQIQSVVETGQIFPEEF